MSPKVFWWAAQKEIYTETIETIQNYALPQWRIKSNSRIKTKYGAPKVATIMIVVWRRTLINTWCTSKTRILWLGEGYYRAKRNVTKGG